MSNKWINKSINKWASEWMKVNILSIQETLFWASRFLKEDVISGPISADHFYQRALCLTGLQELTMSIILGSTLSFKNLGWKKAYHIEISELQSIFPLKYISQSFLNKVRSAESHISRLYCVILELLLLNGGCGEGFDMMLMT